MKRTYAAKRLLEHGPLTMGELIDITGWKFWQVSGTVQALLKTGVAVQTHEPGCRGYVYRLAGGAHDARRGD